MEGVVYVGTDGYDAFVPIDEEWSQLFRLGECERCGGEVQEPNAVKVRISAGRLENDFGLRKFLRPLPEVWLYEDGSGSYCSQCEGTEP